MNPEPAKKYVELVSKFDFGQRVWAINHEWETHEDYTEWTYKVIGPTVIDWMDGDMTQPGQVVCSAYGLHGHFKHDGYYEDEVFATAEEAHKEADRRNLCSKCMDDCSPKDWDCDNCPHQG